MAATFEWDEANGAGETVTHARTESNWKNIDDSTTAYTANPITRRILLTGFSIRTFPIL